MFLDSQVVQLFYPSVQVLAITSKHLSYLSSNPDSQAVHNPVDPQVEHFFSPTTHFGIHLPFETTNPSTQV